jgi:DnaJ family protein C protein 19
MQIARSTLKGFLKEVAPYKTVIGVGAATAAAGFVIREVFFSGHSTPGLPKASNLNGFAPTMTRQEALAILNLRNFVSQSDVLLQHRTLIALHHPDQGGSSYIATKINEARDYLSLGTTK